MQKQRLVCSDPAGRFLIVNHTGQYLTDPGYPWTNDPNKALKFLTQADAEYIMHGLCGARAVMGGYAVTTKLNECNLRVVQLIVVELT